MPYLVSVSHIVADADADTPAKAVREVRHLFTRDDPWVYEVQPIDDAWYPLSAPVLVSTEEIE